jgi:hypothetical protein
MSIRKRTSPASGKQAETVKTTKASAIIRPPTYPRTPSDASSIHPGIDLTKVYRITDAEATEVRSAVDSCNCRDTFNPSTSHDLFLWNHVASSFQQQQLLDFQAGTRPGPHTKVVNDYVINLLSPCKDAFLKRLLIPVLFQSH